MGKGPKLECSRAPLGCYATADSLPKFSSSTTVIDGVKYWILNFGQQWHLLT